MSENPTSPDSGSDPANKDVPRTSSCGLARARAIGSTGSVGAAGVSAAIIAVIPKCPLCWMTLAGTFGFDAWAAQPWMKAVAGILLAIALAAMLVRARSKRSYGAVLVSLLAATAMYALKFGNGPEAGVYLAGVVLLGASVWNALPGTRSRCCG